MRLSWKPCASIPAGSQAKHIAAEQKARQYMKADMKCDCLHEHVDIFLKQANRLLFEVTCIDQVNVLHCVAPTMIDALSKQQCLACVLMLHLLS